MPSGRLCSALFACATWLTDVASSSAYAQTQRNFVIESQDLAGALQQFTFATGTNLIFSPDLVQGKISPYVNGTFSPDDLLRRLLGGSGLRAELAAAGTYVILKDYREAESTASPIPPEAGNEQLPSRPDYEIPNDIVITGTLVARNGYQGPTPVTIVGLPEILNSPSENLADFVNEIPSVAGSLAPQGSSIAISSGMGGVNAINLRGVGRTRTLILLDGQRSVGSLLDGTVDVNNFPQALIERIDVVTGGASAAYGSDAVSGVANFILQKNLRGLRASAEGGLTREGDENWKLSVAAGIPFGNQRGNLLLSGEVAPRAGVLDGGNRPWNRKGCYIINNPAYDGRNGEPERLLTCGASLSQATLGGIITNTALAGVAFGVGGVPYQFNYGAQRLDPWMIGGDWENNQFNNVQSLDPASHRTGVFSRVSYQVGRNAEVFGQFSWNYTRSRAVAGYQFNQGNILINVDNAYLPSSVVARAVALGISQFNLGSMNGDLPLRKTDNGRITARYALGLKGQQELFDSDWQWSFYTQKGITRTHEGAVDITNNQRLAAATDAVRDPITGVIVCRSAIGDPSSGCIPFNRIGTGVNSKAALDYILGDPYRTQRFEQNVYSFSMTGEPFEVPAGLVSLAAGLEHRQERSTGNVIPDYRSGWFVGNFLPTTGSYDVTEGFLETAIPITSNVAWLDSFDLNAAARFTNYSTSGFVMTWKAGSTVTVLNDLTFRLTLSRDIRAPNLQELFAAGVSNTNNVIDPFNGNQITQYTGFSTGNLLLDPEKADTLGVGVVLNSSLIKGLSASVDYYNINIRGAISTVTAQEIVDRCFEGEQKYCAAITRGETPGGAKVITRIALAPFNFAEQLARGIDFDLTYSSRLEDLDSRLSGDVAFRVLATRYLRNYRDDGVSPPADSAGENAGGAGDGPPNLIYRASVTYRNKGVSLAFTGRGVSSGTYLNSNVECRSQCPESTASNRTINSNRLPGAVYFDLHAAKQFRSNALGSADVEIFFNVKNIFDKDPAIVAFGPAGSAYGTISTNPAVYDQLGRMFRTGVRFKM